MQWISLASVPFASITYSFPVGVVWAFFNIVLHCVSLGLLIFLHGQTKSEVEQVLKVYDTNAEVAHRGPSLSSDTLMTLRSVKKKMELIGPKSPIMLPYTIFVLSFGLFGFWPLLQRKMVYFLLSYFSYLAVAQLIMCQLTAPTLREIRESDTNPEFKYKVRFNKCSNPYTSVFALLIRLTSYLVLLPPHRVRLAAKLTGIPSRQLATEIRHTARSPS